MVFSGRSHPDLALADRRALDVELGDVELKTFANDETYVRYSESIRGADVFIVQTGAEPVDRNLMELLLMIQAAKLASAKRITAVIPWFPYSRQDRKAKPREPISGRLVADMLQLAGVDRVLTMDLHAGQIQGFFTVPVDHMTALTLFGRHFRDLGFTGEGVVSVAPDAGRAKQPSGSRRCSRPSSRSCTRRGLHTTRSPSPRSRAASATRSRSWATTSRRPGTR